MIKNKLLCKGGFDLTIFFSRLGLGEQIPNLEAIILTNNRIQDLADLEPLSELKNISMISLLSNPVTKKQHYRLFLIHILPKLRILDFVKVKAKVRLKTRQILIIFGRSRSLKRFCLGTRRGCKIIR
jgi:U2 small nuclear ribonucleoprotein A'